MCLLSEHPAPTPPAKGTYERGRGVGSGGRSRLARAFKIVQVILIPFLLLLEKLLEARHCSPVVILGNTTTRFITLMSTLFL